MHAMLIANIILQWTSVERSLGWLLCTILRADPSQSVRMLDSLQSVRAKVEAIQAAAWTYNDSRLKGDLAEYFRTEFKRAQKRRNEIAHGDWGLMAEHPDDLILSGINGVRLKRPLRYSVRDMQETKLWVKIASGRVRELMNRFEGARRITDPLPDR